MNSLILMLNRFAAGWLSNVYTMTVQTAVLFLFVLLVSWIFRKAPAIFLYYLWGIVLLRFVFFGAFRVPDGLHRLLENNPVMNVIQFASITIEPLPAIANSHLSVASILFFVWAGGILLLTLKLFISEKQFYRSLGECREIDLNKIFEPLLVITGVNQKVRILIGESVSVPFVRGIFRPTIYLPSAVVNWPEDRLRNALMHEIAHIKRRDIIAIALQNILNVLYFFNPVIWLTTLQLNLQREKACDDFALVNLDEDVGKYGKSLLFSLEDGLRQRRYPVMANGLLFPKNIIIKRFDYLYQKGRKIMLTLKPFQKIAVIFVGILAIILACDSESQQPVESTKPDMMVQDVPKPVYVPYDAPPEPIGGFEAIQENIVYPEKVKQAGIEGTVIIQARVDEKGDIQESVVLKSTGNGELDEAALDAIDKSKFKPAYYKAKPVGVYISIPIIFKINNDSAVVK